MLKAVSMIMIAAGLALGGRWLAAYQSKRVAVIGDIITMLTVTETHLRYACLPVTDLLRVLSENSCLSELGFIKCIREKVCFGISFPEAWKESVEGEPELCRMLSDSAHYLMRLGEDIGSTDLEGQLSCCEYYRKIFEKELEIQEEKKRRYSKLFPSLGLLAGISAAIMIV